MAWHRKRKIAGRAHGAGPVVAPPVYLPVEFARPPAPLDFARDWQALGERAWEILKHRRMRDIWPDPTKCEFDRYLELLHRSPVAYCEEVFIGLTHPGCSPLFVPRRVFGNHAYILGGSGSGKTSYAVAQLLIQLAEEYVDRKGRYHPRPPILVMDLKQNGDRYLRALAKEVARTRGQELLFFSNDPEYESLYFDPLYCLRTATYPIKMLETLLKAFSMIYPEGYGSDFFTNEQRVQLLEILYHEDRPDTFDRLVEMVSSATRGRSGNPDARGLYSALATLQRAMHVHTDGTPLDPAQRIDFEQFFNEQRILYVHLDSRSMSLLSKDIGKLMLFALLETASQREKRGQKTQAYVFIDEFHRLAARNVVEMLEDARGAGLGFVLAHQSSSSLKIRDADLYGILFENCSFKQCLTLEDARVIDLFHLIAGRKAEYREGRSESKTSGSQVNRGWSRETSHSKGYAKTDGLKDSSTTRSTSDAEATGSSGGVSSTASTTAGKSWSEEMVSGLTPEMIQWVNDANLLSLVHVKGVGPDSQTPTAGVPTLVQGLYPFLEEQARIMEGALWPLKAHLDPEEYYRKARPRVSPSVVAALSGRRPRRPKTAPTTGTAASPAPVVAAGDDRERRHLEQRLLALAERLATDMLPRTVSVEVFARRHAIGIDEVLQLAVQLGITAPAKDSPLRPRDVAALEAKLTEQGRWPPPRKDNGPQVGPVV